jgi:D-amino-acid dehydrogenase
MPPARTPHHVAVVGAGMVGLSAAWFLQERGVRVTVLERGAAAGAGASFGNAGWLTPALATPLPEPAVLRYGLRALLSPASPVYVPPRVDPRLWLFLLRFAARCTSRHWRTSMSALAPLNRLALESFELLNAGGIDAVTRPASPLLAAFETSRERDAFMTEIGHIRAAGQPVAADPVTGAEARAAEPLLSARIGAGLRLHGQRFIDPVSYVAALAAAVQRRGGTIVTGAAATGVADTGALARVAAAGGSARDYDAVVIAAGAWTGALARPFGVRTSIQSGRGYSFSIAAGRIPDSPVYLPAARVACTPIGDRLRIAGTMEFRPPGHRPDPRRIAAIVATIRPLLEADLDHRADEWAGPRPCTPDGLPLVGATRSPRVFVAAGHGMWGMTLGPVTGRLLARRIVTGERVPELEPLDPLR